MCGSKKLKKSSRGLSELVKIVNKVYRIHVKVKLYCENKVEVRFLSWGRDKFTISMKVNIRG
jgi:hypothetical protein